jgi:hypothetical protein
MGTIGGLQKTYVEKTQFLCGLKSRPPILGHHGGVLLQVFGHHRESINNNGLPSRALVLRTE